MVMHSDANDVVMSDVSEYTPPWLIVPHALIKWGAGMGVGSDDTVAVGCDAVGTAVETVAGVAVAVGCGARVGPSVTGTVGLGVADGCDMQPVARNENIRSAAKMVCAFKVFFLLPAKAISLRRGF